MPEGFIVGIDVGTSKLCSAVAVREAHGSVRYVGHGSAALAGVRAGEIADADALGAAIRRAVEEARYLVGAPVLDLAICVAGVPIQAFERDGSLPIEAGRRVSEEDVRRVLGAARGSDPPGQHTTHRAVRSISLDGRVVEDPSGLSGRRLDVATRDFAVPTSLVERLRRAAVAAGVRVHTLLPQGVAAASGALTPEERESGAAVVDIGGAATDIAVYLGGRLLHLAGLSIGGQHVTADIASVLSISTEEAERLKRQYGAISLEDQELIDWTPRTVAAMQRQAQYGDIPPAAVRSIAAARTIQILDRVHEILRAAGSTSSLHGGVVLTGGGSQLRGIDSMAGAIFGVPVRLGAVVPGDGFPGIVDPTVTASVGLVRYCAVRAIDAPARAESRGFGAVATAFAHPAVMKFPPRRNTIVTNSRDERARRGRESGGLGRAARAWIREFVPARMDDKRDDDRLRPLRPRQPR